MKIHMSLSAIVTAACLLSSLSAAGLTIPDIRTYKANVHDSRIERRSDATQTYPDGIIDSYAFDSWYSDPSLQDLILPWHVDPSLLNRPPSPQVPTLQEQPTHPEDLRTDLELGSSATLNGGHSTRKQAGTSNKAANNTTFENRRKIRTQFKELQDPQKREEVKGKVDIWRGKNPYMSGLLQQDLEGKLAVWRNAGLTEPEMEVLTVGHEQQFMKNRKGDSPLDEEEQKKELQLLKDDKDVHEEKTRPKLKAQVKEWRERLRQEDPEGFRRRESNVNRRKSALRDLHIGPHETTMMELMFERDLMLKDQKAGKAGRKETQKAKALKVLSSEVNRDLMDKTVQAKVDAMLKEWRKKLETENPHKLQQVKWAMSKRRSALKTFQFGGELNRILELAYERDIMRKYNESKSPS